MPVLLAVSFLATQLHHPRVKDLPFDTVFSSSEKVLALLYQSIIAPLLAGLIGFYYGYAEEEQTRFDSR